jgi:hypothetical protein
MRAPALACLLAIAPLWAQDAKPAPAASPVLSAPCVSGPKITPQNFATLETRFDSTLTSLNDKDQVDLLGSTRATYLRDYGLVMTAEVSLIQTPTITPFRRTIDDKTKTEVHARKLAQVPLLEKALRGMMKTAALTLAGSVGMPEYETSGLQVVLAVQVKYLPWEDTASLPGQIVMKANLKNAIAGNIQEEVQ